MGSNRGIFKVAKCKGYQQTKLLSAISACRVLLHWSDTGTTGHSYLDPRLKYWEWHSVASTTKSSNFTIKKDKETQGGLHDLIFQDVPCLKRTRPWI